MREGALADSDLVKRYRQGGRRYAATYSMFIKNKDRDILFVYHYELCLSEHDVSVCIPAVAKQRQSCCAYRPLQKWQR
jgi:hypothetical protein